MRRYKHGFTSLAEIAPQLEELKALQKRMKESGKLVKKEYLDFRSLNHSNLEEKGLVERNTRFFTVKEIPFCGHCNNGLDYHREKDNVYSSVCQRCEIPRRRMRKLNRLCLPTDATGMSFAVYQWDSQEQQERIRNLMNWISYGGQEKSPSVLIWGTPGNGKTSLLYCLAREAIFSDLRVKYISHSKLIDMKYKSFRNQAEDPLGRWLDNCELLLFDELGGIGGSGQRTDWLRSFNADLFQDMYERWSTGDLSIVTTTNLSPAQIESYTGNNSAIMSRFRAMFGKPIRMSGRDRRITKKEDLTSWRVDY
jgi:DNA replication protein DnaC